MAYQKIIHLSDLHLISENRPEVHRFRHLVQVIGKYYAGVPVLMTGDITDSATKPQMLLARKSIEQLAKTNLILSVPGNHDYGAAGNFLRSSAPALWTDILGRPFGPDIAPRRWMSIEEEPHGVAGIGIYEHDMCVFVGLDSGDPSGKEAMARGLITKQLADALLATLKQYPDKVRVVFLHHHPFTKGDVFMALSGSERLMAALKGNCELLLFGHHHNLGIWWGRDEIPLILASHKSTHLVTGTRLLLSVIEITRTGTDCPRFSHSLKVI